MSQEEPSLIRPDHADTAVSVTGGDSGFQSGFKPENVPQINLPDVPQDATGLPPEALAHIPTLTERVPTGSDEASPPPGDTVPTLEMLPDEEIVTEAQPPESTHQTDEAPPTQEPEVQADTWVEQMQVRMDRLMDGIHTLNDRLDRLENKTKV